MVEPWLGQIEAILRFDLRRRRKIEKPHALVRSGHSSDNKQSQNREGKTSHGNRLRAGATGADSRHSFERRVRRAG